MDARAEALQEKLRQRERELLVLAMPFAILFVGAGMVVCGTLYLGELTPVNHILLVCWVIVGAVMVWLFGPRLVRAHRRVMKLQRKL